MSKLLIDVSRQIARVTTGDVWEVEELQKVIKQDVVARELSDTIRVNEKTTTNPDFPIHCCSSNGRRHQYKANTMYILQGRTSFCSLLEVFYT